MSAKHDHEFSHIIYTDGACAGNPGPGGWGSIVGTDVNTHRAHVKELGDGVGQTTNNKMELQSVIEALIFIRAKGGSTVILTDSVYVIKGATQWIFGWKVRGWKNAAGEPVANQDQWEELHKLIKDRKKIGKLEWRYVRGHQGTEGNERCDEIAVAFSKGQNISLYDGSIAEYRFLVSELPPLQPLPEMKAKLSGHVQGDKPTYLSLVNGVVTRHNNWSSCEAVVKGRSGAKFKKVTSSEEANAVLESWGVDDPSTDSKD